MTARLDELIEQITTWPVGMPVRPMERMLAVGEPALPAVTAAFERFGDDPERHLLWLVVLLGELRHPSAVAPLIGQMSRVDDELAAMAAAEALAKIGPPAVPALIEAAASLDPLLRIHAYAGLGWIPDDRSYAALLRALDRDPELKEVVAMGLNEQGRLEAIPALYAAYRSCEPWQRIEFEDVLTDLHWRRRRKPLWTQDWRFRYRLQPALGIFRPSWVWMATLMQRNKERRAERVAPPLRSLEEIVKEPPASGEPAETCEECGGAIERPTGIPVCSETIVGIVAYQLRFLADDREDGFEDLFDLLDELESEEWEQLERGEPLPPAARERWREELDELRLCRYTCEWLIGEGIEEVGPARARLLAEAARLADRYGDPEGLLTPARPPAARGPKIGRNDPCPCGSGRKYKRCCLGSHSETPWTSSGKRTGDQ